VTSLAIDVHTHMFDPRWLDLLAERGGEHLQVKINPARGKRCIFYEYAEIPLTVSELVPARAVSLKERQEQVRSLPSRASPDDLNISRTTRLRPCDS